MNTTESKPLPKLLQSSTNSAKISLTIKGLAVLIPTVVMLLARYGIDASPEDLAEILNQLAVAAGALWTLWGIIRKFRKTTNQKPE